MLPAAWSIWWSCIPLYRLWTDTVVGSFGLHLRLGPLAIAYPWADVFVIVCGAIAFVCGLAIACGKPHKSVVFVVGVSLFALVALGVFGEM